MSSPDERSVSSTEHDPSGKRARTIVLGLGNDLLADDAVGIIAARRLRELLARDIEVVDTSLHGVALLDVLIGYERAILIDAIQTGEQPVGSVMTIDPSRLRPIDQPSPHYTGLPELLALAERLEVSFPRNITILAVEVRDLVTIGGAMSPEVQAAIPELCRQVTALAYQ